MDTKRVIRGAAKEACHRRDKKYCKYPNIDPRSSVVLDEIGLTEGGKKPAEDKAAEKMAMNIYCTYVRNAGECKMKGDLPVSLWRSVGGSDKLNQSDEAKRFGSGTLALRGTHIDHIHVNTEAAHPRQLF